MKNFSDNKLIKKNVPATQALLFTIARLSEAIAWLEEIEKEWEKNQQVNKDGHVLRLRSHILKDAVAMYVSTLAEPHGSGHSLVKSYAPSKFVKEFLALPIVKKCQMNRNNRSGHESKSYGGFVSSEEILVSELRPWVKKVKVFLELTPENNDPST